MRRTLSLDIAGPTADLLKDRGRVADDLVAGLGAANPLSGMAKCAVGTDRTPALSGPGTRN
jgi:hypothetical protein